MPKSTEQTDQAKKGAEKKQRDNDIAVASAKAEADKQRFAAPVTSPDKDLQPEADKEKEFYPLLRQPEEKDKTEEEEPEPTVWICRGDVCVQVDMDISTAAAWCAASNALLDSDDPKDQAKREEAWNLLSQGKQAESMQLLGVGADARSTAKQSNHVDKAIPTQPMTNKPSDSEPEPRPEESEDSAPSPFSTTPKTY
jgi:hypothetical protein